MNRLQQQWSTNLRVAEKTPHYSYQEAMRALNGLVSNAAVCANAVKHPVNQLEYSLEYSKRIGMTLEDHDQLSVIHVAGTKGKGSTCAYTESILRNCGYKTGFFSSPHLINVTERIRINGAPISKDKFAEYFWHVYSQLEATKGNYEHHQMPGYFQFLTTLAFYVFLKENVDVTILEVGIGGQYDCTNIVRFPVVCGITSIGYDHQNILGSTLDSIAWQKAGIFKPRTPAVTLPQCPKVMSVLLERAQEIGCPLYMVPEFHDYDEISEDFELVSLEPFQHLNISLALQLSKLWLYNHDKDADHKKGFEDCPLLPESGAPPVISTDIPLLKNMVQGIKTCEWLGRVQTVKRRGLTYYLDGAHTLQSMKVCCQWFEKKSAAEIKSLSNHEKVVRILIFNLTGSRKPKPLLSLLKNCAFDIAIFITNMLDTNLSETKESNKCKQFEEIWHDIDSQILTAPESHKNSHRHQITEIFPSINDAILWCQKGQSENIEQQKSWNSFRPVPAFLREATHVQILVTGSIHLVGGVLALINHNENQ